MSIGNILNTALAGLHVASAGIDITSRNIGNADQPGYTRKTQDQTTDITGAPMVESVRRTVDAGLRKTSRDTASSVGMLDVQNRYATQISLTFGAPADANSLSSLTSALGDTFLSLATRPEADIAYTEVVYAAQQVAGGVRGLYQQADRVATNAGNELDEAIARANQDIGQIDGLNKEIIANIGGDTTDLEDQRDQAIFSLAAKLDITTFDRADGGVSVYTKSGTMLVDVAASKLSSRTVGVGQTGLQVQLSSGAGTPTQVQPRSGSIAGLLDVMNQQVPALQGQLDTFATGLADATANAAATIDFDHQPTDGQTLTVMVYDGTYDPTTRIPNGSSVTFEFQTTPTAPEVAIGLDQAASLQNLVTAMQGHVPPISVSSNSNLLVLSSQYGISTTGGSAVAPIAPVPLFDAPSTATPVRGAGFGRTIGVNPLVSTTPSLIRSGSSLTSFAPGDARYIDAVGGVFQSNTVSFGGSAMAATNSLAGAASDIITGQSTTQANLAGQLAVETTTQTSIEGLISSESGVNLDTEFSHLLQLQQAYAANARIVSTTQSLFNTLLIASGGPGI